MDKIWYRNPSKSEVIGRCGGDEKNEWPRITDKKHAKIFDTVVRVWCIIYEHWPEIRNKLHGPNALQIWCYMCIKWTGALYYVVITGQSNHLFQNSAVRVMSFFINVKMCLNSLKAECLICVDELFPLFVIGTTLYICVSPLTIE